MESLFCRADPNVVWNGSLVQEKAEVMEECVRAVVAGGGVIPSGVPQAEQSTVRLWTNKGVGVVVALWRLASS